MTPKYFARKRKPLDAPEDYPLAAQTEAAAMEEAKAMFSNRQRCTGWLTLHENGVGEVATVPGDVDAKMLAELDEVLALIRSIPAPPTPLDGPAWEGRQPLAEAHDRLAELIASLTR